MLILSGSKTFPKHLQYRITLFIFHHNVQNMTALVSQPSYKRKNTFHGSLMTYRDVLYVLRMLNPHWSITAFCAKFTVSFFIHLPVIW